MQPIATQRVSNFPRGPGYAVAGMSGTIGAALAADSLVFAMYLPSTPGGVFACIDYLRLAFTTIVAFTTPVTAARRLGVYRAVGAAATGGTPLTIVKKDTAIVDNSAITDARIATTAALGAAGITRDADDKCIAVLDLAHVGAAGGRQEFVYELGAAMVSPIELNPNTVGGELLVVSNPIADGRGGHLAARRRRALARAARRALATSGGCGLIFRAAEPLRVPANVVEGVLDEFLKPAVIRSSGRWCQRPPLRTRIPCC